MEAYNSAKKDVLAALEAAMQDLPHRE